MSIYLNGNNNKELFDSLRKDMVTYLFKPIMKYIYLHLV